MDPEVEKYYNNFFDLFTTEGWKQLLVDLEDNVKAINSVESVTDANDMYFKKGQINVLNNLLNMEYITNNSFEEIKNGQEYD
mgnify:FL=1